MSTKWAWKAIQPRKLCSPVPLSDMTEVDDVKKKKKKDIFCGKAKFLETMDQGSTLSR